MTPIEGLVKAACSAMDSPLLESAAVLHEAMLSARALCDSSLAALADVTLYDLYRAEFRIPSEPPDLRQEPDSIPQAQPEMRINVQAVVRQIQEAVDGIQAGSVNVPAVYSSFADAGRAHTPPADMDRRELSGIPAPDTSLSREYSRELARGYTPEPSREIIKETVRETVRIPVPTAPREGRNRRAPETAWYRGHGDKPGKPGPLAEPGKPRSSSEAPAIKNAGTEVRRSTRTINEMEKIIRNVVRAESIVSEVWQSSSAIEQLRTIRANMMNAQPVLSPVSQAEGTDHIVRPIDAPGKAPAIQQAKTDAEANAGNLSKAFSGSIITPSLSKPATGPETVAGMNLPPISTPLLHVSRAMAAINGSFGTIRAVNGFARPPVVKLAMAGNGGMPEANGFTVSQSIAAMGRAGSGLMAQSPIVSLVNNVAAPGSPTVLVHAGREAQAMRPQARPPVISLSVGVAAAQAAQKAGTSAIREFVLASPSIGGSNSTQSLADRGTVNVSMPGVTVEREASSGVSRTSNFHNTFNINITMKGGSEESDMKELGKKIGRILSDEIKRYGGA